MDGQVGANAGSPYPMRNQEARARRLAHRAHRAAGSPLDALDVGPRWADAVTLAGLAGAVLAGVGAAYGRRWAVVPWVGAAFADALDGALARRGGGGPHGAFLDSCADRVSDGAVCAGVVVRELAAGRHTSAGLVAWAGLAGAVPSYVTAAGRANGLDPGGAGPGRLARCAAWALALAVPRTTAAVSGAIIAGSGWAGAQRYARAVRRVEAPVSGPPRDGSDTGAVAGFDEDAP